MKYITLKCFEVIVTLKAYFIQLYTLTLIFSCFAPSSPFRLLVILQLVLVLPFF